MELVDPASFKVLIEGGVLDGANGRYLKRFSDLRGLYADSAAFEAASSEHPDRIVYEVTEFRPSERAGDMIFGVTRMVPGRIGNEFFLTRGHIHARPDRPEIYFGQRGTGVMQMESPSGETRVIKIEPQSICYVPPYWIHRSVNIGDDELVMMFGYPADSGQDYSIIEKSGGMRHRVIASDNHDWELIDNATYVPRSSDATGLLFSVA
jgi:glucose-6-phosphate isomerase, archaeal